MIFCNQSRVSEEENELEKFNTMVLLLLVYFEERYQDEEKKAVFVPLLNSYRALALIFRYAE